jgi:hypothetical protein
MREYVFDELGFFSPDTCERIKAAMDGRTFMNFKVKYSNCAGNCTLIVATECTDYDEKDVKSLFLHSALSLIAG